MRRSTVIGDHFDRDQTCQHSIVSVATFVIFMNASQKRWHYCPFLDLLNFIMRGDLKEQRQPTAALSETTIGMHGRNRICVKLGKLMRSGPQMDCRVPPKNHINSLIGKAKFDIQRSQSPIPFTLDCARGASIAQYPIVSPSKFFLGESVLHRRLGAIHQPISRTGCTRISNYLRRFDSIGTGGRPAPPQKD